MGLQHMRRPPPHKDVPTRLGTPSLSTVKIPPVHAGRKSTATWFSLLPLSKLLPEKSRRRQAGGRRTPPGEGQASGKPGVTKGGLLSSSPLFHPPQLGPHPGKRQVQDQVGGHGRVERDRDRGPVWWRRPSSWGLKAHPAFLCPPHLP